jgi:hypothetical protein
MSVFPGSPRILKGAFVSLEAPGAGPRVIVFPYNPETLCRTLQPAPAASAPIPTEAGVGFPVETIVFTLAFDATDALEQADPQAEAHGVSPVLSALELLMYSSRGAAAPLTLFVWGEDRILPVRLAGLRILERLFSPNLAPLQVSVEVTLTVASADPAAASYLEEHRATLTGLAASAITGSLAPLGIETL